MKATRLAQEIMKKPLGIRQMFKSLNIWQTQRLPTVRVTGRVSQRSFVDKQPSLLHAHGNYTDRRKRRSPQSCSDLRLATFDRGVFRITMHEE